MAGGNDAESWKAFFATLPGAPTYVVADGSEAIRSAVRSAWPEAMLYVCESHLRMNGEKAAQSDRIFEWVPKGPRRARSRGFPVPPWLAREETERQFARHPIWNALRAAQMSPALWDGLKAVVDAEAPNNGAPALRAWIAAVEPLVLAQFAFREAHKGERLPRSTGAAETLIRKIKKALEGRSGAIANRRRLDLVLDLIRVTATGEGTRDAFRSFLRKRFESDRDARALVDWTAGRDHNGSSLDALIREADVRHAKARVEADNTQRAERSAERNAAVRAERAAAGLPEDRGRPLCDLPRTSYRSIAGEHVADRADLMAQWHPTRNEGLDPSKIRCSCAKQVWWRSRPETAGKVKTA